MADIKNNPRVTNELMQENEETKNVVKTIDFKMIGAIFIGTVLFLLIVIAMTTEWFSWINIKKLFE
jgi:hypothetical protein